MVRRHFKRLAKRVISPLADLSGVYDRRLHELDRCGSSWTIVMYHRIIDDPTLDPFGLGMCVSLEHFKQQVAFFKQHFHVVGLADGVAAMRRGEVLPRRSLSITFDDGYLDNLTLAAPVLQAAGLPATLFVITGKIECGTLFWWDRIIEACAITRLDILDPMALGLPAEAPLYLSGWSREPALERLLAAIWRLPREAALEAVERVEHALLDGQEAPRRARRLSAEQLRALRTCGFDMGAHTVHHTNMCLMTESDRIAEMHASAKHLSEMIDAPVHGFAYPAGHKNREVVDTVRAAGFDYAVSTDVGINLPPYRRFQLARIGMPNAPLSDFKRAFSSIVSRALGSAPGFEESTGDIA